MVCWIPSQAVSSHPGCWPAAWAWAFSAMLTSTQLSDLVQCDGLAVTFVRTSEIITSNKIYISKLCLVTHVITRVRCASSARLLCISILSPFGVVNEHAFVSRTIRNPHRPCSSLCCPSRGVVRGSHCDSNNRLVGSSFLIGWAWSKINRRRVILLCHLSRILLR